MSNVKPGDLAYIADAEFTKENIGLVVEVVRAALHGDIVNGYGISNPNGTPAWVIRSAGTRKIRAMLQSGRLIDCAESVALDRNLRRISGPDVGLEVLRHDAAPVKGAEHA